MFGLFRRNPPEVRSADIDVGALYSQFFAFGASAYNWQVSPAILAATLSVPDAAGSLLTESRRLSRVSPLLSAYERCMTGGVLTGEPEAPEFDEGIPERTAAAAADLWVRAHDCELERELLHRLIVDGEVLLFEDGTIVPSDGFTPEMAGASYLRTVSGYKIGRGSRVHRTGYLYLGDRRRGDARALPWIGGALPYASALSSTRISAGHGLGALAKLAAVISNSSPDRIAAGAGHRSGLVDRDATNAAGTEPITSTGVGSVPYLRAGESVDRVKVGPDREAREYEGQLEKDAAAALNLPLSELLSDYSSGSFSNLKMAWTDASREYRRRRLWWHRNFRLPIWRALLSNAFADGQVPRMTRETMAALRNPTWPGPRREAPQPEKEAHALALLTNSGIYTPEQALEKLEN